MPSGSRVMKKNNKVEDISVERSSGNVYADLGLPNPDEMLAKAKLVSRICAVIEERKLTQIKAAELLGIDQPKVSSLMRGKFDGYSSDRLFRFLNALGQDIEIVVRPARKRGVDADIRVVTT